MRVLGWQWDWYNWSLSIHTGSNGWKQLFAFKCSWCKRFHWGCKDHWFCGLCEPCHRYLEKEE